MAGQRARLSKRFHIVLIPGFAGFDALGQLEYYASVTPFFQKHCAGDEVLHYFDNFPTAAVVTRAARLRSYLAKRMARGEISGHDDVILVGHSTGGLDIRQLIWTLHREKEPLILDGGARIEPERILERVRRAVFLSVPHWGTNIADWVHSQRVWREAVMTALRAAVETSQAPLLDRVADWTTGAAACLTGTGLLRAVQDTLREANERHGRRSPMRSAEAHEAAAHLGLFLRQMTADFRAIDDLTSYHRPGESESPAHFTEERDEELKFWRERGIHVRSYATVGKRLCRFQPGRPAPPGELSQPWTCPEAAWDCALSGNTDIVYRTCYRVCACGPFQLPKEGGKVTRRLPGAPDHAIEVWDNDGIVNTASMLWRAGENVLVPGDHMDVVGHYRPIVAGGGRGREFEAYDLMKSDSGFGEETFKAVWGEILRFCRDHRNREQ